MGLSPTACRLLIRAHHELAFEGPLLTLGNQDVFASHTQLQAWFEEQGCPVREAEIVPHTSRYFQAMMAEQARHFVHARTFFGMMGIGDYADMDKLEDDSPIILHDLNEPVTDELVDRFNVVIDGGTLEHIFDVRQTLENVVRLCRVGGHVVHLNPCVFLDHGFFGLNPCLYHDFYRANGFGEFHCYLYQPSPQTYFERVPFFPYTYGMGFEGLIDPRRQVYVFFAAKKLRAVPFVVPMQGFYESGGKYRAAAPDSADASSLQQWRSKPPVARVVKRMRPLWHQIMRGKSGAVRLRNWVQPRYKRLPRI